MSISDIIKSRKSIRKYKDEKVPAEMIDKILEAARYAPSAKNLQPIKIIVCQSNEAIEKVSKSCRTNGAKLVIITCADHSAAWERPFDNKKSTDIDASIVTDHMMLQATELGLGSVWICYFKPDILREEFNIPDNIEPINILALGFADEDGRPKVRKDLSQIVSYDKY